MMASVSNGMKENWTSYSLYIKELLAVEIKDAAKWNAKSIDERVHTHLMKLCSSTTTCDCQANGYCEAMMVQRAVDWTASLAIDHVKRVIIPQIMQWLQNHHPEMLEIKPIESASLPLCSTILYQTVTQLVQNIQRIHDLFGAMSRITVGLDFLSMFHALLRESQLGRLLGLLLVRYWKLRLVACIHLQAHILTGSQAGMKEEEEEEEEEEENRALFGDEIESSLYQVEGEAGKKSEYEKVSICRGVQILHLFNVYGDDLSDLLRQAIQHGVDHQCKGRFEVPILEDILLKWIDQVIVPFVKVIFYPVSPNQNTSSDIEASSSMVRENQFLSHQLQRVENWRKKLIYFAYRIFGSARIFEMFDIIVCFPESLPALQDLHACLHHTEDRTELVKSLRASIQKRLLHPGASTIDIIGQYVNTMKALHVLDPTGHLTNAVCGPIKQYLRKRDDTMRCIVNSLTNPESDLHVELREDVVPPLSCEVMDSDDEDYVPWRPRPPDNQAPSASDLAKDSKTRRIDIVAQLVGIFGNKDMFLKEYRNLLSSRLLQVTSYGVHQEKANLERLKLRFGSASMRDCEIMLRDIVHSKRINAHVTAQLKKEEKKESLSSWMPNATIISDMYWPKIRAEKVKLPTEMEEKLSQYTKHYEAHKGARTLKWIHGAGIVNIRVRVPGKEETVFQVSPAQLAVLWAFQKNQPLQYKTLHEITGLENESLRLHVHFWSSRGILIVEEDQDTGEKIIRQRNESDIQEKEMHPDIAGGDMEDEATSSMAQEEAEQWALWSTFIIGMLGTFGSLSASSIHSNLSMTMPDFKKTEGELVAYLKKLCQEDKIILQGGMYSKRSG